MSGWNVVGVVDNKTREPIKEYGINGYQNIVDLYDFSKRLLSKLQKQITSDETKKVILYIYQENDTSDSGACLFERWLLGNRFECFESEEYEGYEGCCGNDVLARIKEDYEFIITQYTCDAKDGVVEISCDFKDEQDANPLVFLNEIRAEINHTISLLKEAEEKVNELDRRFRENEI